MVDDLANKHPFLARFCIEESIEILPYVHTHQCLVLRHVVADPVPERLKADYDVRKSIINQCLELAYRYELLDSDRRSRLKGSDNIRFWSLLSELKVALWLENQGLRLEFNPPAREGGIGDFKVSSRQGEVFIEVKTLFGDREMLVQEGILSQLCDYLESQQLSVSSVDLLCCPSDLADNNLDAICHGVQETILPMLSKVIEQDSEMKVTYDNNEGLVIEITLSAQASIVGAMTYGGVLSIDDQLRCKLGMPVNGHNYRLQVSAEEIPSLVIVHDRGHWVDDVIGEILYGTRVGTSLIDQSIRWDYREKNGKWDIEASSPLSAVGVYRELFRGDPEITNIYLCPKPEYPIYKSLFNDTNIRWWRLGDDHVAVVQDTNS
ncbi:hypothetical protein ACFLXE_02895 [Chloroflexota bacterium]